ncbi:hypothetical protein JVU11DRAFT_5746 [Chiua virens]|nr:hypothetical protein JVU11DRAFT_5746 [Chiua virens]
MRKWLSTIRYFLILLFRKRSLSSSIDLWRIKDPRNMPFGSASSGTYIGGPIQIQRFVAGLPPLKINALPKHVQTILHYVTLSVSRVALWLPITRTWRHSHHFRVILPPRQERDVQHRKLAQFHLNLLTALVQVIALPPVKRNTPSTRGFVASYAADAAHQILETLIWEDITPARHDDRLHQRVLVLAEKIASSAPGLELRTLLDLCVAFPAKSTRLRINLTCSSRRNPRPSSKIFIGRRPRVHDSAVPGAIFGSIWSPEDGPVFDEPSPGQSSGPRTSIRA